jgi:hypothetical protein
MAQRRAPSDSDLAARLPLSVAQHSGVEHFSPTSAEHSGAHTSGCIKEVGGAAVPNHDPSGS